MNLKHNLLVALLFLPFALMACAAEEAECPYKDSNYPLNTSFEDGCYQCTCNADTTVTCTTNECAVCVHEGKDYNLGDNWPAGDGCNFCTCEADGNIACTEAAC